MYHFMVNRSAGNGRGEHAWKQIQPILDERRVDFRVSFPQDVRDAFNHIRRLSNDIDTLVIVGGDGTIQSVLSALVDTDLRVAFIPAGSGNDVARGLQISLDPKEAVRQLLAGTVVPIDLIEHNGNCYATAIGVGFDGAVAFAANKSWYKKWLNRFRLGRLAYVFALVQVLFRYRPTDVTLTLDRKSWELSKVWLIAICNFPSYGGGMNICPHAKWDDGVLEVCVVRDISRMELLRVFPLVYSGRHTEHKAIHMFRAKHIQVSSQRKLLAHGDGELVGTTPLEVGLHQEHLNILTSQVRHAVTADATPPAGVQRNLKHPE